MDFVNVWVQRQAVEYWTGAEQKGDAAYQHRGYCEGSLLDVKQKTPYYNYEAVLTHPISLEKRDVDRHGKFYQGLSKGETNKAARPHYHSCKELFALLQNRDKCQQKNWWSYQEKQSQKADQGVIPHEQEDFSSWSWFDFCALQGISPPWSGWAQEQSCQGIWGLEQVLTIEY